MKELEEKIKRNNKILKITSIVIVVLLLLLFLSSEYGNFTKVNIKKNNNTIFSISDLTVNNLKYSDSESKVRKELGVPKKEETKFIEKYNYKILTYDGIIVTLKENYNDYMLVKVEITDKKYTINRNIKIKDNIVRTIKKFKVENKKGTYLYGNYSVDALDEEEIMSNIYFGIRSETEIVYISRDAKINSLDTNIAKLNISYKNGKVTKIEWSYDYK